MRYLRHLGASRGALIATAVVLLALGGAAPAAADPLTELTTVPGRIHDATANRVLWRGSNGSGPLFVRDLTTGTDTQVPLRDGRQPVLGSDARLFDGGVLFESEPSPTSTDDDLDEWRTGDAEPTKVDDSRGTFDVNGGFVLWNRLTPTPTDPFATTLFRRNLTTGDHTMIALDAGNADRDAAANGDVVYWTGPESVDPYEVYRWRAGVATKLSNSPSTHWSTSPLTDGTLTVYRRVPNNGPGGSIFFSDGSSETELPGSGITPGQFKPHWPERNAHYRVVNGWIAYTGNEVTEVRLRSPLGTISTVDSVPAGSTTSLVGLAPNAHVMYRRNFQGSRTHLGAPGENPFPLGSDETRAFWQGDTWYVVRESTLLRVETDTAITSGPPASTNDDTADFVVASSLRSPEFECQLDGADAPCADGTHSATGLSEGPHTFSAVSKDASGEEDTSPATMTWRVDSTSPTAPTLLSPGDGQATRFTTLEWSAATDPEGGGAVSYRVFIDGALRTTTSSTTFTPTSVSEGTHSWFVQAVDGAGNTSDSATRTFTFDTTPPTVPELISPADGETVNSRRPTLRWSAASDSGTGLAGYEVELTTSDPTPVGPDKTEFTPTKDLADDPYLWRVVAIDAAGNRAQSPRRTFTVDQRVPEVSLHFDPNPALTGQTVRFDASATYNRGVELTRFEWDLDGNGSFEVDTGASPRTERAYDTAQELSVGVRVTDVGGRSGTRYRPLRVTPAPPPGPAGMSINAGARFTNDPNVMLSLRWPPFATQVLVSNDGGFDGATPQPVMPQVAWQLDSSGAERLPKTAYVRFLGGVSGNDTYQDDIILDETPPAIRSATVRLGKRVTRAKSRRFAIAVRAVDTVSGLAQVQIATDKAKPSEPRRYASRFTVTARLTPRWIRVVDAAGNRSRWARVATR